MKFMTAMLFGSALIVGVAIGYMFNPSVGEQQAVAAKREKASAIRDDGDTASIKALRARIAELEAKLAAKGGGEEPVAEAAPPRREGERGGERRWGGMSPKEWRERMKKEDPARYAQMTNGIARMRRNRHEQARRRSDFLASVDVSRMSEPARRIHEELRDLVARREEFEQKMHALHESETDLSGEEMGAMMREMHETSRRIAELNESERRNLILETARNLGMEGDEADEVADVMRTIIENTDSGWGGHHGGRGGRPGGR